MEYELRFTRDDNTQTITMQNFTAEEVIQSAYFYSLAPCAVGIYHNGHIVGLARHGNVSVLEDDAPELAAVISARKASS